MSTVYLKKLSGEVITLVLSPSDLLYPAVGSLGVEPGYTFTLFSDQQEELPFDATPQDGETLLVAYMPLETRCRILYLQQVLMVKDENTWDQGDFYEKLMVEILGRDDHHVAFVHRMFFYTQNIADVGATDRVYIPSDSVQVVSDSDIEYEDRVLLTGEVFHAIEDLIENLVPRRFSEEIRTQMKEQILEIWKQKPSMFF
jgi:hypothetical protein